MKFLRRMFLSLGVVVLTLLVLFLLNLGIHRMIGPSKAQNAALAKIAEINARPAHADNAFALLWLMRYDVDDDQIEAIATEDVRRAQALIASGEDLDGVMPADRPVLPQPASADPGICETRDSGCLARVRSNPELTRELLSRYPRTLQRARNLEGKMSFRNEVPFTMTAPLPFPGSAQRLRLSELALAWQDGERDEALTGTCRNIASWRRMRHGSNSLIISMIALAYADSATRLFGDMLAELPHDDSLPADCAQAFAPITTEDVSLCTEMGAELLLYADALAHVGRREPTTTETPRGRGEVVVGLPLVFDAKQSLAWQTQQISDTYCSDRSDQQALQDHVLDRAHAARSVFECAANITGCMLNDVAAPAYEKYSARLLDSAAHLRLGATVLWLRETRDDARPIAMRFADRPAHLHSGERASGVGEDGRSIWVNNLDQQYGARFSLPLAPPLETQP